VLVAPSQFAVRRLPPGSATIDLVAGTYVRAPNVPPGTPPALGAADEVPITSPYSVAVDGLDVYHLDGSVVRYVTAGLSRVVIEREGVARPLGLAAAPGALYLSDTGTGRILRYAIPCGVRCGEPSVLATGILNAKGLAVGADGTVYVAEAGRNRIIGIVGANPPFVVAGGGASMADGVPGPSAVISGVDAVAVDSTDGAIYFTDTVQHRVRKVSGGIVATVAGTGGANWVTNWTVATDALLQPITQPSGLAIGGGALWIASELDARIYRVPLGASVPPTATVPVSTPTRTASVVPTRTPTLPPTATVVPTATRTATAAPTCFPGCLAVTL